MQFVFEQSNQEHESNSGTHAQILRQKSHQRLGLFVVHYFWEHIDEGHVDEHAGSDCHNPELDVLIGRDLNPCT